ncbi:hypothetical protein QUA30_21390 [Microcoleus sp. Pol14C2]|uniref:hypothetical protein n=1 Tax=unclassified Microcoleus TaxID=2642155 RepID=UPI002FCF3632
MTRNFKQQLLQMLLNIPATQSLVERKALLNFTGFNYLIPHINSLEKNSLAFVSELIELILAEGKDQLLIFLNNVVDSEFIGFETKQTLNAIVAEIGCLDSQQWNSEFTASNKVQIPVTTSSSYYAKGTETVYLNLLEIFFPKQLYISDLVVEREKVIEKSKDCQIKLKKDASTRDVARAAIEQAGLAFGVDWICHEGKIVTFHDLRDDSIPISAIVDRGTTTSLDSQEFYKRDRNFENVFKSLLGRCLQQKLYRQDVVWQHQEKLFIFVEIDGNAIRKEEWYGEKKSTRTVYERVMKNNKPDEILSCKHQAFRTQYRRFGQSWYLTIIPDWFFSFDGYRRSFSAKDKLDWLKREENNKNVYNHLRFIVAFLKTEKSSDLFVTRYTYPFLGFGELITFENAPLLNDDDWNPKSPSNGSLNTNDWEQIVLPLDL